MKEFEITELFLERMTQKRLALMNYRILVDKGFGENMKDVRRLEQILNTGLEKCGGIEVFNQKVRERNVECHAERGEMKPVDEWP